MANNFSACSVSPFRARAVRLGFVEPLAVEQLASSRTEELALS